MLWSARLPGGDFDLALAGLGLWALAWAVWLAVAVAGVVALPAPRTRRLGRLWPLLAVPVLFVGSGMLVEASVPERVAFSLSRDALEGLVVADPPAPGRAGLYEVTSVDRAPGCTHLVLGDAGFLDVTGFAHCTAPPVDDVVGGEGTTYRAVDGPWYVFTLVW